MAQVPAVAAVRLAIGAVCLFFVVGASLVRADDAIKWKTGADFNKALREPINRSPVELPVGEALSAFGRHGSVATLLDRRVDPNQLVQIAAENVPLLDELKDLAKTLDLGVATIPSIVYVGPKTSAARLEALIELRRREVSATSHKTWLSTESSSWDELAEPRDLAAAICSRAGAKLANPNVIPHDVWRGWSGPALTNIDQLTLVLAGFDLTFALHDDGAAVEIIPAPQELVFERTYEVVGVPATVASDLKRMIPELKQVQPQGTNRLRVVASVQQHAQVADLLAGKRTTTKTVVKPGEQVYTLTVENQPVGKIVQTLAKARGVEVKADTSIVEKLKELVSVQFENATFETALKKVLDPAGIRFKLSGKTLELSE